MDEVECKETAVLCRFNEFDSFTHGDFYFFVRSARLTSVAGNCGKGRG